MGSATEDRAKVEKLAEGDIVRMLLDQHARIRELFTAVKDADGESRGDRFGELRALLAVHETGEEMILRPVSQNVAGKDVTDARMAEEKEANHVLAELEKLDANDPDFLAKLGEFEKSVLDHAEHEENEEFPAVLDQCSADEREAMGSKLKAAEAIAPTRPHPSAAGSTAAQYAAGPFASLVDRTRDVLSKAG